VRKKNVIVNINYDDKNQVVYIKRYNKKEDVINLCDLDDKLYNKLYKQIRKSMKFCKFYTSNKIFIYSGLLIAIAIFNMRFPIPIVSSFIFVNVAWYWRYADICERIEKENSVEFINNFFNSSFNDDYCCVNTKNNINSLSVKNSDNKVINENVIKNEKDISVDSNIINIISDIRDMIMFLDTTYKIFYCQRLNCLIDEYKEIRDSFLSEEQKVRFLSKLIILTTEVEELLKVDCEKNKRLFRNKNSRS